MKGEKEMKQFMNWLTNEESGQGMVEYGLILSLISVVVIVALSGNGTQLNTKFQEIDNTLKRAAGG